jgi:nitrogen fixation protein NifU and related proteins
MYSAQLLDYFQNPRNVGDIENPDGRAQVENPVCGDVLRLTIRVSGGKIVDIRFKARGCVPSMACASALTEMVLGRTISDARALRREQLVERVGGLPPASGHAGHLALEALRSLLDEIEAPT